MVCCWRRSKRIEAAGNAQGEAGTTNGLLVRTGETKTTKEENEAQLLSVCKSPE
jgi:hypothetical protein